MLMNPKAMLIAASVETIVELIELWLRTGAS